MTDVKEFVDLEFESDIVEEIINSVKGCIWRLTQQAHQYHVITALEDIADDIWSKAYNKERAKKILSEILGDYIKELEAVLSKDAN